MTGDGAAVGGPNGGDQLGQSSFARTAFADEGGVLAGRYGKRQVLDDRVCWLIAETEVVDGKQRAGLAGTRRRTKVCELLSQVAVKASWTSFRCIAR